MCVLGRTGCTPILCKVETPKGLIQGACMLSRFISFSQMTCSSPLYALWLLDNTRFILLSQAIIFGWKFKPSSHQPHHYGNLALLIISGPYYHSYCKLILWTKLSFGTNCWDDTRNQGVTEDGEKKAVNEKYREPWPRNR